MGAVYFYHVTRRPLVETLRMLLERALAQGWRVAVRGTQGAALAELDLALWRGAEEDFLPHGLAGGPHDALQPVLLTTDAGPAPNGAVCLMSVGGAVLAPEEVGAMARACVLFDGTDPDAVAAARVQWKALTSAGLAAQYWSEASGRWEKKAET